MIKTLFILISLTLFSSCITSQTSTSTGKNNKQVMLEKLPFHQIPDAPESYTAESVAARMIDGLGYRYYWATKGLTANEMDYKPSDDSRSIRETLEHLAGLSQTIAHATLEKPNIRPSKKTVLSWEEQRTKTLNNLKAASDILHGDSDSGVEDYNIIFQRGEKSSSFPFWNMINGPIADAIWHTGQIVMMRRAAGNPLPPGVNVLTGKTSE